MTGKFHVGEDKRICILMQYTDCFKQKGIRKIAAGSHIAWKSR